MGTADTGFLSSTREGKIQVELAQLKYRAVRLVGMRNSLSRLGGGIGTRGPGEKKLETDRRLIHQRISQLKEELEDVKRHREVTRQQRGKDFALTAAIVGYTNAGKSTLLNRLTGAQSSDSHTYYSDSPACCKLHQCLLSSAHFSAPACSNSAQNHP